MNYIIIYHDGNDLRATKVDLSLWDSSLHPFGLEDCAKELALPPGAAINAVISNEWGTQYVHIPSSEVDYSSGMNRAYELGHILYETIDNDKPDVILDRNGEVVLALCRRCNKGEAELEDTLCIPCPPL